jgi:hypothetical protein
LSFVGKAICAAIEPLGVLGNSGEAGETLVWVSAMLFDRCATGIAIDRDFTLWVSGGDAINRLSLNGHLIERIPIEPHGSIVNSRTFAVLNETLYFLGNLPDGKFALFAVSISPTKEKKVARPVLLQLPERRRDFIPYCLAPQPLNGQLVLACEPKELLDNKIGVYFLRLPQKQDEQATFRLAFTVEGELPQGVAVDERAGLIYLGGYFGWFVSGETHPSVYAIAAFRSDGTMLEGFPVACSKTPAIPTQFRGVISLAGEALWDTAWYGFLARLDKKGQGAPGRVIEWHHELGYPSQVLMVSASDGLQLLAITTAMPNAVYLAHWDESAQQLNFVRRLGCLPVIASVGLSEDDWVTVGTERAQLWWRWDDAANAPPRKAELHIAVTPLFFHGDRCFALAAQYRLDDLERRAPVPTIFHPRVGDRNEAMRVGDPVPMRRPVGLTVQKLPDQTTAWLFVTDQESRRIWRTRFDISNLRPDMSGWQPVGLSGETLKSPTDIFAFTDGKLLVADEGRLLLLSPDGEDFRVTKAFDGWGSQPVQKFGKRLRFAVDGAWLLVSDTDRHRVIWLDWTEWKVLGVFGETDKAGNDLWHLNFPTFVALKGDKAVVADSGNQRLIRLQLRFP